MATRDLSRQVRTASGINLVLGVWLIISPWVYGYALDQNGPTSSSVIVGLLVLIFAALRYNTPHGRTVLSWANIILGAWSVLSPWIFRFMDSTTYVVNSIVVGCVIAALAVWSGSATLAEHRRQAA